MSTIRSATHAAASDPAYLNVSFVVDLTDEETARLRAAQSSAWNLGELNKVDVELHRAGIGAIAAAVADAAPGGVLIHCHAGKDRTGMSVGILLFAGRRRRRRRGRRLRADHAGVREADRRVDRDASMNRERERMRQLAKPTREAMLEMLAHVNERYGGAEQYLLGAGVTEEQIKAIRSRLIES